MVSVLIEININVEDVEEANEISKELHGILNDGGYTNSVNVADEISE